jgi:hypothetical protein
VFQDKRGGNWHGIVCIEPTGERRGVFGVTVRIEHEAKR